MKKILASIGPPVIPYMMELSALPKNAAIVPNLCTASMLRFPLRGNPLFLHVRVCTLTGKHSHMSASTHACSHLARSHARTQAHTHTDTHTHTRMHACIRPGTHARVHDKTQHMCNSTSSALPRRGGRRRRGRRRRLRGCSAARRCGAAAAAAGRCHGAGLRDRQRHAHEARVPLGTQVGDLFHLLRHVQRQDIGEIRVRLHTTTIRHNAAPTAAKHMHRYSKTIQATWDALGRRWAHSEYMRWEGGGLIPCNDVPYNMFHGQNVSRPCHVSNRHTILCSRPCTASYCGLAA